MPSKGFGIFLILSVLVASISIVCNDAARKTTLELITKVFHSIPASWLTSIGFAHSVPKLSNTKSDALILLASESDRLFSLEELKQYDGSENSPGLHIAILGRVYDVAGGEGERHYQPGSGYSCFAAKDGSRAFVTGEFNAAGLTDDVTGLPYGQLLSLEEWVHFYEGHYKYIGKVVGNFYSETGEPTEALKDFFHRLAEAHKDKETSEEDKRKFPPCNSSFKQGEYRRVWCSNESGGIKRSWVGYPRQYFQQGTQGPRCACVQTADLNSPSLKEYDGCDPAATVCDLPILK